ncbi:MAG: hypothetical protein JSR37_07730 [Verrucomicrobia bacterium]|nr:hypothetical protein [Verrucomicrobiota bacterium]MBS0636715.1 hypothetical protein [Verrucomicrobiota bacterium]
MITPYSSDGIYGTLSTAGGFLVSYRGSRISSIGFDTVEYGVDGRIKTVGSKPVKYNLNGEITHIGNDTVTYKNGRIATIGYKDVQYH